MASYFKVFQSSFKVIYRDQTAIKTSTLPAIGIFIRSNLVLKLIFQNSEMFISFVSSLSPNWLKGVKSCISCIEGNKRFKMELIQYLMEL